jgi:hypothetical protein
VRKTDVLSTRSLWTVRTGMVFSINLTQEGISSDRTSCWSEWQEYSKTSDWLSVVNLIYLKIECKLLKEDSMPLTIASLKNLIWALNSVRIVPKENQKRISSSSELVRVTKLDAEGLNYFSFDAEFMVPSIIG